MFAMVCFSIICYFYGMLWEACATIYANEINSFNICYDISTKAYPSTDGFQEFQSKLFIKKQNLSSIASSHMDFQEKYIDFKWN